MRKIAIIHFLPIEMFPPTINLLNRLSLENAKATLFSCKNHKLSDEMNFEGISQVRFNTPAEKGISKIVSVFRHIQFNFITFINLLKSKPDTILYYETFSAFPVYLYKKFYPRNTKVFIHCHEYYTQDWYKQQSSLLQYYHRLEKSYLYGNANWISHTNYKRQELFHHDFPNLSKEQIKVLPNYPPQKWQNQSLRNRKTHNNRKFVYIGTLSSDYTYIEEFCDWIKAKANCQFDIYCYNIDSKALYFLSKLKAHNVRFFHEGIEYCEIPKVLANYDIGLILYKALTINFKYNATNKLFEYLACDLDVWFPKEMLGCYEYVTKDTWPQVKKVDFANLESMILEETDKDDLSYKPQHYSCEEAFCPLIEELITSN